ncbi:MAG: hypothetical protein JKY92_05590 [Magnetovibrio sp.]|nr:hypothetical protein [Magnetovibrio sp.]
MSNQQTPETKAKNNALTWVLLVGTFLVVLAGPTMIVLFFGLLPSFVAIIVDHSKGKSAAFCVGSINFIGVFPYVVKLWGTDNTFNDAFAITTDLLSMLVMYASAAFGWLFFMFLPPLIASVVVIMQQRKVAQLRGEQKDLIEEWGADVTAIVDLKRTPPDNRR